MLKVGLITLRQEIADNFQLFEGILHELQAEFDERVEPSENVRCVPYAIAKVGVGINLLCISQNLFLSLTFGASFVISGKRSVDSADSVAVLEKNHAVVANPIEYGNPKRIVVVPVVAACRV